MRGNRNVSKKSNRTGQNRRSPIKSRAKHTHLYSIVETTLTLKSSPKNREDYPLAVSDVFNQASIGADTDIRMIGYNMKVQCATGQSTQTVSMSLAHDGDWVRSGTNDGFNQQFVQQSLRRNTVIFNKRLLPRSEREYLSPQTSNSGFLLRVDDPCGVIPGDTLKITMTIHFIRPHLPVMLVDADSPAVDKYQDQDVATAGSPGPSPIVVSDIPKQIEENRLIYSTTSTASPFTYSERGGPTIFTVTVVGANKVNKVGRFVIVDKNQVQQEYTNAGYVGTIN